MQFNPPILITVTVYLILIFYLGFVAYQRTQNIEDYILGGRKLGSIVTALSVGASDMSGWLLLGLPGAIYLYGISAAWIAVGLVIGAYFNWLIVAKPLRVFSFAANNALTLPDYFENRFHDKSRVLRLLSAVVILVFFTFYTASGLVGGAVLFESSFGMDYSTALLLGAFIIVTYTFMGGFLAVSWTDAFQAMIMLLALIIAPLIAITSSGGIGATWEQAQDVQPFSTDLFNNIGALGLISLLAWGLGYFGQPHLLVRFMAAENPQKLFAARRIAMVWMVIVLLGSLMTGFAGIAYFADAPLANPETVFIELSRSLFNPWIAGLVVAAILSAIMSTISSQLLVSSSAISEDFYRVLIKPTASDRELLVVSRGAVMLVALIALFIASDRNSRVLDLVSYSWAGFGAAFGPVILFSLYWRKMTRNAAVVGMVVGATTVVVWPNFQGGVFEVYEILPGFLFASAGIVLVSLLQPNVSSETLLKFDSSQALVNQD